MLAYLTEAANELVKIDANHANFVRALVMCTKPQRILEMGFGAGEATRSILSGLRYNERDFEYIVVDNWFDFGGIQPEITKTEEFAAVKFITSGEYEFVKEPHGNFNFIFSDADHYRTQLWFEHVYTNLLSRDGVLIYHDVTNPNFPNLLRIYTDTVKQNYDHILFNSSSRRDERCGRGMLVIFKH
jgi:predicted O-methyltransferase YrrM